MNTLKKSLVALVVAGAGATAQAEVSASVDIASSYLWRGFDLSFGSAVVSGSLDYAHETGFYAGIWGSSGDDAAGTEYDLYAGWAGSFGDFGVDISYVDYNYPTVFGAADFAEVILGLSYQDFGVVWANGVDNADWNYYSAYAGLGAFTFTYGFIDVDGGGTGSHVDIAYSYTDNLTFTLSQSFDKGVGYSEEVQFVVSYSIPIN